MARKTTTENARAARATTQTTAHALADKFDSAMASARADLRKPAHQSNLKRTAAVGTVFGLGALVGVLAS